MKEKKNHTLPGQPVTLPCPAKNLVPHAPPMLVVGQLIEVDDSNEPEPIIMTDAVVPRSGPFVANGRVLPDYCIELMAQSAAAGRGFMSAKNNRLIMGGMLAAIDRFIWYDQPVPGELLLVRLQQILSFGQFHVFAGTLHRDRSILAEGKLKICAETGSQAARNKPFSKAVTGSNLSIIETLKTEVLKEILPAETNHEIETDVSFSPSFPGFNGHFPSHPVLPAVAQTAAVRALAEQATGKVLEPVRINTIKFTQIIQPGEPVSVRIGLEWRKGHINIPFSLAGKSGKAAFGEILYRIIE